MRRTLTRVVVVGLAVLVPLATVLATDASAARHRHRRNHFHRSPFCPSNYQAVDGVCEPVPAVGPPGVPSGSVAISPNVITLSNTGSNTTGDFDVTGLSVTGLPASVPVSVTSPQLAAGCAPGKAIIAGISGPDANGRLTFNLSGVTCTAAIYQINFTETGAPNQVFSAFIKLTK